MTILNVGSVVKDDKGEEYELIEMFNNGGFGCVFLAKRKSDQKRFAVKTFLPSFGNSDNVAALKNEIAMSKDISGENIIHYEYVHNGDEFVDLPLYIIMEYAENGTLQDVLEYHRKDNKLFSNDELLNFYLQLVNGMEIINRKLIHRDIKPENILVCGNTLKITDFGLAKISAENTRTMTFKGGGTPLYMSPEAWDYSKNTIQMDIYSMGIIFYDLATLQYPYTPKAKTAEECKAQHLYSAVINPQKYNSSITPTLVSVINRMLEKNPKKRFEKWSEISEALKKSFVSEPPITVSDRLVDALVAAQNNRDTENQRQESIRIQKENEKKDFIKLVRSQFINEIIIPIQEFIDDYNTKYFGNQEFKYYFGDVSGKDCTSVWTLRSPIKSILTINVNAFFKEDFKAISKSGIRTTTVMNNPRYRQSNVIAGCEISNSMGFGFNLILVESDEIYGNWYIMDNHNNFSWSTDKERQEPFAFSLDELPKEINSVQITHLYSADFVPFDKEHFLSKVFQLVFPCL